MSLRLAKPKAQTALDLICEKEAANLLGVRPNRMARDRWEAKHSGTSPKWPYFKVGKYVKYDRAELLSILAENRVE